MIIITINSGPFISTGVDHNYDIDLFTILHFTTITADPIAAGLLPFGATLVEGEKQPSKGSPPLIIIIVMQLMMMVMMTMTMMMMMMTMTNDSLRNDKSRHALASDDSSVAEKKM